jgi:S1-C subfamily serine protease
MLRLCAIPLLVLGLMPAFAWSQATPPPLRAAVPILCTETRLAGRTRVRGTGIIADSGGTLITAAHVIEEARPNCTLSVMVPDEEWSRFRELHAFLIQACEIHRVLDLAVCRVRPLGSSRDWGYIRAAAIQPRSALPGETISITAFTGFGLVPLMRRGHITARQNFQRGDGCHCDFAIDISTEEGMSGSPVTSAQGEVLGILTLAGGGKFRNLSFGTSFEEAAMFLRAEGVTTIPTFPHGTGSFPTKTH